MITGHTGFEGSWLTFPPKQIGVDVLGYALAAELGAIRRRGTACIANVIAGDDFATGRIVWRKLAC